MANFDLGRRLDVVTSLFSSIAYAKTAPRLHLHQAVATMARHVRLGGVLIIVPFFAPQAWIRGQIDAIFVDRRELTVLYDVQGAC